MAELACLGQLATLQQVNRSLHQLMRAWPLGGTAETRSQLSWSWQLNRFSARLREKRPASALPMGQMTALATELNTLIERPITHQSAHCAELLAQRVVQSQPLAFTVKLLECFSTRPDGKRQALSPALGQWVLSVLRVGVRQIEACDRLSLLTLLIGLEPLILQLPDPLASRALFDMAVLLSDTDHDAAARWRVLLDRCPQAGSLSGLLDQVLGFLRHPATASPREVRCVLAHLEREPAEWTAADLMVLQALSRRVATPQPGQPLAQDDETARTVTLVQRYLQHLARMHKGEAVLAERRSLISLPRHVRQAALATLEPATLDQFRRNA
jgi:hypothetical protein